MNLVFHISEDGSEIFLKRVLLEVPRILLRRLTIFVSIMVIFQTQKWAIIDCAS